MARADGDARPGHRDRARARRGGRGGGRRPHRTRDVLEALAAPRPARGRRRSSARRPSVPASTASPCCVTCCTWTSTAGGCIRPRSSCSASSRRSGRTTDGRPRRRPLRRGQQALSGAPRAARRPSTGLTLSIPPGEVLGLLGPNGAGKTTTLEMLVGLRRPTSGRISVLGVDPATDRDAVRRQVAIQPQHAALFDHQSVRGDAARLGVAVPRAGRRRARRRAAGPRPSAAPCECASSRAVSASGCSSLSRWCLARGCWCSTSRRPGSTPWPGPSCGR